MNRSASLFALLLIACGDGAVGSATGPEPERRRTEDHRQNSTGTNNTSVPTSPEGSGLRQRGGGGGGSVRLANGQTLQEMMRQAGQERDQEARRRLYEPTPTVEMVMAMVAPDMREVVENEENCDAMYAMMQTDERGQPVQRFQGTREDFDAMCANMSMETAECFQRGEAARLEPECRRLMQAQDANMRRFQRQAEQIRRGEPTDQAAPPPEQLAPETLQRERLGSN